MSQELIQQSFLRLKNYCEKENFKGWDPYDGLNSRLFNASPLVLFRLPRLAWIQLFKKNPVNFRNIFLVPKGYNPKALGLFLTGYCNLYKISPDENYHKTINFLIEKLFELQSKGWSGACWGYNFPWQSRTFFHPKYTPTVVVTSFVANALLDAYEITGDKKLLETARSSCDFILKDLNRTYSETGDYCFSYSPLDKTQVFNASLLGSRLLARVYKITGEQPLFEAARKSVNYCISFQREDGSWLYGTLPHHHWIDSFHTGFNLECISDYINYTGDNSFRQHLLKGKQYYLEVFFTPDGVPKYYNTSIYPVDIHCSAQLFSTLFRLGILQQEKEVAETVLAWTIKHMQDQSNGYFYYQEHRWVTLRIPYMRWSQAWMFYAMTFYLSEFHPEFTSAGKIK